MSALSAAIHGTLPWAWLGHQWWFIGAVLFVGLVLVEAADMQARR